MRILNLYAGIGGNRKLWGDEHEVTAVENVDYIAERLFFSSSSIKATG
jgi:DNA (cytosine-5)-methyltransferase 1